MQEQSTPLRACLTCDTSFPLTEQYFFPNCAFEQHPRWSKSCRTCIAAVRGVEGLDNLSWPERVRFLRSLRTDPEPASPQDRICPECRRTFPRGGQRWHKGRCDDCTHKIAKMRRDADPEAREKGRSATARITAKYKIPVLRHYGGTPPRCACCGEREYLFLGIDHINGGGNAERRALGLNGYRFYRWLIERGFPAGYQILCLNCNAAKGAGFLCPHEVKRRGLKGRVRSENQTIRMAI